MHIETHYAKSGSINIAYQVIGKGSIDIVLVQGWVSHLEKMWEEPNYGRFLHGLSSIGRLIVIDKRGTGLSDRVPVDQLPTMDQRMDDVRAVMDEEEVSKAVIIGFSEGGPLSAMFAARYPGRTISLIIIGGYASRVYSEDYPWAPTPAERQKFFDRIENDWGGLMDLEVLAPTMIGDVQFEDWWIKYLRASASPGAALALAKMNTEVDIRPILPQIMAPTLLLHRTGDRDVHVGGARYMARRIPNSKLVELPGEDHLPWVEGQEVLAEIISFVTGKSKTGIPDRLYKTVMFTDIVDSTQHALLLGDTKWRDLLEEHDAIVRKGLKYMYGEEVDRAGDGFFAVFDEPSAAVRCAALIIKSVEELGIQLRVGIHSGECVPHGTTYAGVTLHIGARISARAKPGELLFTRTVMNHLSDSKLHFLDQGDHMLKGIPVPIHLYSVDLASVFRPVAEPVLSEV